VDWVTERHAAALLGYELETVRRAIEQGWLPSVLVQGERYVPLDEVCELDITEP
jgi:hypothetical protein